MDLLSSETKATIGNADVNWFDNGLANAAQDVAVVASNQATAQTFVLAVAGGFVGIGGAVDVGSLNNNTAASIIAGARVKAKDDISVNAAAVKSVDSLTISGAGVLPAWRVQCRCGTSARRWTRIRGFQRLGHSNDHSALERNKKENDGDPDKPQSVDETRRRRASTRATKAWPASAA